MPISILTNNHYMKTGLSNLALNGGIHASLVLVDLDSFECLADVREELTWWSKRGITRVCFIGVNGILFEIFGPLKPLSIDEPLVMLKQAFLTRQFTLLKDAISFVEDIQRLSMLTNRQKQCLKALKVYGDVYVASRRIGLSEKNSLHVNS